MIYRRVHLVVGTFIVAAMVAPSAAPGQLIGHYGLDEINAGMTPDSTGINGAGVLNGGPTLAAGAGKIGSAFSFAGGTGEYVGINDASFGQTAFTASVWFKPNTLDQGDPLALWDNTAAQRSILIRSSSTDLQAYLRTPGVQIGGTASFPTESLTTTDFNHAVITYDGQTLRTYLNGELTSSALPSFGAPGTPLGEGAQATLAIGGRGSSEGDMVGLVDDVALWSETLTDGKVAAIFNLADEAALNYDAGQADLLFQVFNGDLPSADVDGLSWTPADGLGGSLGDVVDLGDDSFFLNLDGSAGVVGRAAAAVPEPASVAMWLLLGVACVGLMARRRDGGKNGA